MSGVPLCPSGQMRTVWDGQIAPIKCTIFLAREVKALGMTFRPTDIKQAPVITSYDRENLATYLFVFDAKEAGIANAEIVRQVWGDVGPLDISWVVGEHLKRARWFTTTGYLQLLAEDPKPRDEALDDLVASGSMSSAERPFLDSPAGEKWWPRHRQ